MPLGEVVCMTEKQGEIIVATRSRQVLGEILGDWSPSQPVLSCSVCHHFIDTHLSLCSPQKAIPAARSQSVAAGGDHQSKDEERKYAKGVPGDHFALRSCGRI